MKIKTIIQTVCLSVIVCLITGLIVTGVHYLNTTYPLRVASVMHALINVTIVGSIVALGYGVTIIYFTKP